MFTHNFIYSLKVLLKNKMLIFWTFAFPILLGIFFNMAFSDIEKNEKLPEDLVKDNQDKIQKLTDKFTGIIDSCVADKEKEVLTV